MENLVCYKQMPIWTHDTIPSGFQKAHNTKLGTWARLHILKGQVQFAMLNEAGETISEHSFSREQQPPFIPPQAWHKIVSSSDDVACQLSFYCQPQDYFSKKYQLTATHSEVLAATPYLHGGKALDVGCGSGRNSLYLSQQGFTVDAWDVNPNSIETLNKVIQQENISNLHTQLRDLNLNRHISRQYDFICCTVVMMFLQPETVKQLITQMQQATEVGGFNLIVCAMDSENYPVQPDFPFSFRAGELREAYQSWTLIKYNEDVGELHRVDTQGQRIKQRFATLLAQKC
ncbi:SAM-dependent methyltransferase TehB [Acinetobacter sp. VNH17]|uniref:SAM-dependent methyltransferase TehB n=1 Tax=Acinetobacter thutiue TaxID=2998078 RepID=A0ABT7WQ67_9GAMM|nr:SAM-dependent methyltransferase TehB [Acinetobacter thutiue]MCY6412719.1 SAM-dependent methyltransferase TehB [Acinetobacter thutiue]MDN0014826.1 SAM-dependent methyltransferase TehB [Acinetobacter thutiue]